MSFLSSRVSVFQCERYLRAELSTLLHEIFATCLFRDFDVRLFVTLKFRDFAKILYFETV